MADGTDELEELEAELDADGQFQDDEATAAMSEAQSVIDDAKTAGAGVDLGDATDTTETTDSADSESDSGSGSGSLLPSLSLPSPSVPSLDELWSTRFFLVAAVAVVAGSFGAGLIPLVDGVVAGGLGVLGVSFVLGLASSGRHYLETGVAGAAVLGLLSLFGRLEVAIAVGGSVARLAAFGAGVGLVASLLGTYLGRDVREGLLGKLPSETDDDTPDF
jgi:hypothetical protein